MNSNDTLEKKTQIETIQRCCMLFKTNSGPNILQKNECTATYLSSQANRPSQTFLALLEKLERAHQSNFSVGVLHIDIPVLAG